MLKAQWLRSVPAYLLCFIAFAIPLPFVYSAIGSALLFVFWILQANPVEIVHQLRERKLLWPWLGYFMLFALSYFYSDNKEQSLFDLQSKLTLFIFPVIIGAGVALDRKKLERILFFFTIGISLVAIICMLKACILWQTGHDKSVFFYHELVEGFDANAVYMAWYCLFSITILLFLPWKNFYVSQTFKALKILSIILQILFFILLSARMLTVLFFIFLIPAYFGKAIKRLPKSRIVLALSTLTLLVIIIFSTKNPLRDRFANIFDANYKLIYLNDYSNIPEGNFNNLTLRLFFWRIGIENINEHHLWLTGAGNGDAQALQNAKMHELKIHNIDNIKKRSPFFNANLHNMFMQTLLMVGLPGVILLIIMCFSPLFFLNANTYGNIFLIFNVSSIFFLTQEAALQTQAGIVYYSFFSMIFWNMHYNYKQHITSVLTYH